LGETIRERQLVRDIWEEKAWERQLERKNKRETIRERELGRGN
jgi:hypothetical protein